MIFVHCHVKSLLEFVPFQVIRKIHKYLILVRVNVTVTNELISSFECFSRRLNNLSKITVVSGASYRNKIIAANLFLCLNTSSPKSLSSVITIAGGLREIAKISSSSIEG